MRFKTILLFLFFASVFLSSLIFISMYGTHDVSLLVNRYPHRSFHSGRAFDLKIERPSHWVSLDEISSYGKWAIILSEDWSYFQHKGIDLEQIKIAFQDLLNDERVRGASTITQQLIKNIYLTDERTIWRKLNEIILALKIEGRVSKNRILETYLNSIEYGPGIHGIKAAARHYFNKHPSELSPRESAFLAMMLPSPKRYYVSFRKKKITEFAYKRINSVLEKLRIAKVISRKQYEEQKQLKFSWEVQSLP